MPRTVNVIVPVIVPDDSVLTDAEICRLVDTVIDVGEADAAATVDDPDLENTDDAEAVCWMEFGDSKISPE